MKDHDWVIEDGAGDPRKPLWVRHTCSRCRTIHWNVCGTHLFHPDGPEALPLACKEPETT